MRRWQYDICVAKCRKLRQMEREHGKLDAWKGMAKLQADYERGRIY